MRNLLRRLGYLLRRRQMDADLSEEIEIHRALTQERLERAGLPPEDAAYASRRALGNITLAREDAGDIWILSWLEGVGRDLHVGARGLIKQPGFTIVAILTMAFGIGANTAVFSLLDASVFRVLPVQNPEELVFLGEAQRKGPPLNSFSYATFERLRDENRTLADIVAYDPTRFSVTIDGSAEMRRGEFVTGNYFDLLGVRAAAGRLITAADDDPKREAVAVISHRLWAGRFNRDPSAIGRQVTIGKTAVTIVGVTPRQFQGRDLTNGWSDVMLPMALKPQLGLRDHTTFGVIARLKPGVSIDQAAQELTAIRRRDLEATGTSADGIAEATVRLKTAMHGELPLLGPERPNDTKQARLIAAAVAVVLLVACVNIACLLLARSAARQKEIAVRLAIGAGRARLVRQLLTESLLLSALGGAAGLVYLGWTARVLATVLPVGDLPFDPRQDMRTLAFAAAASIVTGLLFGIVPALAGTRVELAPVIQGSSGGRRRIALRHRLAKSLVASQVALSLALLVGAGLLVRSLTRLYTVETGFASQHLLSAWIYPSLLGFDHPREMRLYRDLLERLSATPGVASATMSRGSVTRAGSFVAPGFFGTVGIEITRGRDFSAADTAGSPRVAIVSESVVLKHFTDQNPIGQPLPAEYQRSVRGPAEIVGVVKEVRSGYRQRSTGPAIYGVYTQAPAAALGQILLYVRSTGAPLDVLPAVRESVKSVEPDLALFDVMTVAEQLDGTIGAERSTAMLLACLGALALVLASIGLFGTMSHSVASRTKELGIRMSLGADRSQLVRMILRETAAVVAIGVAIGLPIAIAGTRLVANLLFGIEATDPITLAAVVVLLALVTALAGYLPARRASRVDPMLALRYE
ncbi:MAG TPA: ABC transporter permease [Vicinamibacterales bacterium]|jgi:ABC-type antimicrobial peptide transport system permease subunit